MDAPTIKMIDEIIKTVGFPIFVSVYFMFRSDRRQNKIIELLKDINKGK